MYRRNHDFSIKKDRKDACYFHHRNGGRIRTDPVVAGIWRRADGKNFHELYQDLNAQRAVSNLFLRVAVELMVAADLLHIDGRESAVPGAKHDTLGAGTQRPSGWRGGELPPRAAGEHGGIPQRQDPDGPGKPLVSVIIVNQNGCDHLADLMPSLRQQNYPNLEVVLVDNGSTDGSLELIGDHYPEVRLVKLDRNYGFAAGNNFGIREARGDYLLLLNNDTKLHPRCIEELVDAAAGKSDWAAIVPKIDFFDLPGFINAIGNSVPAHGWGYDNFIGYVDMGQFDHVERVFSACFGAAMLSRRAVETVGLLDEGYRFYYEDADWCYRAWSRGLATFFAPRALVYHKFSASMKNLATGYKIGLVTRNRLRFAAKNLSAGPAVNFLRHYLKEDLRHALGSLRRGKVGPAWICLRAWTAFGLSLPGIWRRRRPIQRAKSPGLKDAQLFALWPEEPTLLDENNHPLLDSRTIRRIYFHLDNLSAVDSQAASLLS